MIVGLGTDAVELQRIEQVLGRRGERFVERVFTERERAPFEGDPQRVARIAARFAAKEAALKALGTGWGQGVGWHDVEVLGGRGGPPALHLSGAAASRMALLGATRALLSFTHTDSLACATVLLASGAAGAAGS